MLYRQWSVPLAHAHRDIAGEHRAILDAVLARDVDAAAAALAAHIHATTNVLLGADAARAPGARVDQAAPMLAALRNAMPLPVEDELIVRGNGAVQVVGGALLALGKVPQLAALALAGSLIPTTLAGHAYWEHEDPTARKLQRIQFHKNMAMIGACCSRSSTGTDASGREKISGRPTAASRRQ